MKILLTILLALSTVFARAQTSPTVRFDSIAAMVAFTIPSVNNKLSAIVSGGSATGDSFLAGEFAYSAASTATTNQYSIFKPLATTGRWIRITGATWNQTPNITNPSEEPSYAFQMTRGVGTNALHMGASATNAIIQTFSSLPLYINPVGANNVVINELGGHVSIGAQPALSGTHGSLLLTGPIYGHTNGLSLQPGDGAQKIYMFKALDTDTDHYFDVVPENATTQAENRYGQRVFFNIANGNTAHAFGSGALLAELNFPTSNAQTYSGRQTGLYGSVNHRGSGNLSDARALYSVLGVYGTGNVGSGYGLYLQLGNDASASGTFTDVYGAYATAFLNAGSGVAPANFYGFYVDAQTVATNNYAFVTEGNSSLLGSLYPYANATYDLGSTTNKWRNIVLSGDIAAPTMSGAKTINGTTTFAEDVLVSANNSWDLGKTAARFRNGWFAGTLEASGAFTGGSTMNVATSIIAGGATPNAAVVLQADSVTKGFLPPRMTTAEKNAIVAPPAGLIVYDTTLNKLCVFTTVWETITSL